MISVLVLVLIVPKNRLPLQRLIHMNDVDDGFEDRNVAQLREV